MTFQLRRLAFIFFILITFLVVYARTDTEQIELLNAMNRLRRAENRVPLVINDTLQNAAERLLADVSGRDLFNRGDTLSLSDGTGLEQLLADAGYPSYNGIYEADVMTLILRDYLPNETIDYWNQNYQVDEGLQSKQMKEGFLSYPPIFFDRFREVGIAYQFNEANSRHYYVFIFASQPDVFPISITSLDSNDLITSTLDPHVLVHISNYVIRRNLMNATLQGDIDLVRISESPNVEACPDSGVEIGDWQTYRKNYEYTLSDGQGEKVLYVQLCDAEGNTITTSASIYFGENPLDTPTPSPISGTIEPYVWDIVYATQTAAVQATAYPEIHPTVEAILTATAAAQP